jgi:nitrite reductase/ring-hydroxylating ferredoxin subunit
MRVSALGSKVPEVDAVAQWVAVGEVSDLGERTRFEYEGRAFALFRLEDGMYALDDVCSHEYSRLSDGEVWDDEVYCPKHGSRFDIRTGKVLGLPAFKPVSTYPVKVEGGMVYVDVGDG